jgi:hypothetical protein
MKRLTHVSLILVSAVVWVAAQGVWGQDVQVNSADNNAPNLGNETTESETYIARSGNLIVVGYNTTRQVASTGLGSFTSLDGFAWSTNNGQSFTDGGFMEAGTTSLGTDDVVLVGDPALAFDSSGNLYYASLLEDNTTGNSYVGVNKSASTSPSVSFGSSVVLSGPSSTNPPDGFEDKEFIAIDNTGGTYDGRVYVAWTDFSNQFSTSAPTTIMLAASSATSPTLTFSTPLQLASSSSGIYHGAFPAVGPDGSVYVAWVQLSSISSAASATINLVKSVNGGATFTNPDPADTNPSKTVASFTSVTPDISTGTSLVGNSTVNPLRTRTYPFLAVDNTPVGSPTRGNLYCVFAAQPSSSTPPRAEIYFTASTDGGKSWSAPRDISSGLAATIGADSTNNDNWFPAIAVSPVTGHIRVLLYSRREDPANQKIRVYEIGSTDAGMTFYNQAYSAVSFVPSVGYDPLLVGSYMGDYLAAHVDSNGMLGAWGDTRNDCNPPAGASSPCSPTGRGDQDVWSATETDSTGVDLAITPWGAVTGVGAEWQSPDIFVLNSSNQQVNAQLGVINQLNARIRNLGNADANGAVVRFRFAPWYTSVPDSAFEVIGTVTVNAAAGAAPQVVPINWNLTNLNDTNNGVWPAPISTFSHFCVRVDIEYTGDINLSNNAAQSNFFDVTIAQGAQKALGSLHFIIGNPYERPANVQIVTSRLPQEVRTLMKEPVVELPGIGPEAAAQKMVTQTAEFHPVLALRPRELQVGTITLTPPPASVTAHLTKDLVYNVNSVVNGKTVGGFSILLARANVRPVVPIRHGPAPVVSREVSVPQPTGQARRPTYRFTAPMAAASVRESLVQYLISRKIKVEQNDAEHGLVSSGRILLSHAELVAAVPSAVAQRIPADASGEYFVSFRTEEAGSEGGTPRSLVTVSTRIMVNNSGALDSPLRGRLVPSNGHLEQSYLTALEARFTAR